MKPSILDRLLDTGPDVSEGPVLTRGITFRELRDAVEQDLDNLLNTRCFPSGIPASCREVKKSLLMYGLTDFTSKNPSLPLVRTELRQEIEQAITLFEPRLRNVMVRIESPTSGERRLMFKISALLQIDDEISEPVSFDTYYDSNRGEYSISRQR
ncbi:MAG TPA: type VI secretion system baseplate subunit TssE [Desulfuromonadales bacterium]|nr:type VI secretion system baseplate subunit TssE [Desulfuromonadales bacterium]